MIYDYYIIILYYHLNIKKTNYIKKVTFRENEINQRMSCCEN